MIFLFVAEYRGTLMENTCTTQAKITAFSVKLKGAPHHRHAIKLNPLFQPPFEICVVNYFK